MKRTDLKLSVLAFAFMAAGWMQAQSNAALQAYWVHEDDVKPSMVAEYEGTCQELLKLLKENDIKDASWIAASTADNRYMYVSPIENMAALDQPVFKSLRDKVGTETLDDIFGRMDKCYDIEKDYVLYLDPDLSYMPEGLTQTPENKDYRKFHYLRVSPGNRAAVKKHVKSIKDLFASKGSKEYYRVYRSGFGSEGEFYMVAVAAKDEVDYAQQSQANNNLLGEEGDKAFGELFGSLLEYEEVVGRMRPDLYYIPE